MNRVKVIVVGISILWGVGNAVASSSVPANPKKNPKQAFDYVYNLEVKQNTGDEWADYLLGKYYETGYGTKKNIEKAYVWYRMSVDHHYKPAIKALARLKKLMSPDQIHKSEKLFIVTRNNSIKRMFSDINYATTH